MGGIGDFFRGAVRQLPESINTANEYALQARNLAVKEKYAKLQEQDLESLKQNREQERNLKQFQFYNNIVKMPAGPQRDAALKIAESLGMGTPEFFKMAKTLTVPQLEIIRDLSIKDPQSIANAIDKAAHSGAWELVATLGGLSEMASNIELKKQQASKYGAEAEGIKQETESFRQTANILRGGTSQAQQPSGLPSISAMLPGGGSPVQQPIQAQQPLPSQPQQQEIIDSPELQRLQDIDSKDEQLIEQLMSQTDSLSKSKVDQLLSKRRITQSRINQLSKGYSPTISKALADSNMALREVERVRGFMEGGNIKDKQGDIVGNKWTGPLQGRQASIPGAAFLLGGGTPIQLGRSLTLRKLKKEEAIFRSAVKLMRTQMRKAFFGAAQTKTELAGSLESIPDTDMNDVQFLAALDATEANLKSHIEELEKAGEQSKGRGGVGIGGATDIEQTLMDIINQ
jgi:hypothetical protein